MASALYNVHDANIRMRASRLKRLGKRRRAAAAAKSSHVPSANVGITAAASATSVSRRHVEGLSRSAESVSKRLNIPQVASDNPMSNASSQKTCISSARNSALASTNHFEQNGGTEPKLSVTVNEIHYPSAALYALDNPYTTAVSEEGTAKKRSRLKRRIDTVPPARRMQRDSTAEKYNSPAEFIMMPNDANSASSGNSTSKKANHVNGHGTEKRFSVEMHMPSSLGRNLRSANKHVPSARMMVNARQRRLRNLSPPTHQTQATARAADSANPHSSTTLTSSLGSYVPKNSKNATTHFTRKTDVTSTQVDI